MPPEGDLNNIQMYNLLSLVLDKSQELMCGQCMCKETVCIKF